MTPPQETGIRNEVVDAVRRMAPTQSNRNNFLAVGPGGEVSRRQNGIVRNPRPQKGRLIQKIQRQVASWAKAPPIRGPVTEPTAHVKLWKPNHLPRSRKGTRSVMRTSVRHMMPPPPRPWMVRPINRVVKFRASAPTIAPTVKKTRATRRRDLRPRMYDSDAKAGWKTVEDRKKDVPHQKAAMALPWSDSDITWVF